ncbi:acyltransferase [Sphingomonas sp. LB-2]|uniref:acyltransferase family protein n=1 Tax=Sphingomonas caeni TaxID=2984949 RepID=UPI0022329E8C|nr:acyltransferase [Sphingomonas caeni]MCW3848970.1 acyltransferase [Sphingomonas caeni]
MSDAAKHERLDTLQAGRAAAAFAVVLFHLNGSIFDKAKYFPGELFVPFRTGHVGVEFFFVLSGFLMTWLYAGRLGERAAAGRFLYKRALRIYPTYWAALLAILPVYFLIPGTGKGIETDPFYIVASILLLPTPEMPILGVAWTLQFEMFFYLVFAGLLAFPRLFKPLILLWAAAAVARMFLPEPFFPLSFFTNPWILLFLIGGGAALVARRGIARPLLWVALGVALFAVSAWADEFTPLARGLTRNAMGLGAGAAIVGLVTAEAQGRIRVPRWLAYLGDASYALYLVHVLALSVGAKLLVASGLAAALPRPVSALLLIAASLIAGILLHEIVEKRLMKLRPRRSGPNLGAESAA